MTLTFIDNIVLWFKDNVMNIVASGVIILVSLIILIITKFLTSRVAKKQNKNKRAITVAKLIQSICKYTVFIISLFAILACWGIDVTAAVAGLGVVSLIVGLGAQDLIKDFLAGVSIVFDNRYEIDDVVEINGFKGKVTEIGLRTTKLINATGEVRIIANGSISTVSNFSRSFSLASISVGISYEENIDRVISLLEEKLPLLKENYPQIIEGPSVAGVDDLADSCVIIKINAKTNCEEHYGVSRALKKYIKELFDENGIEIPFPQVVVHNKRDN